LYSVCNLVRNFVYLFVIFFKVLFNVGDFHDLLIIFIFDMNWKLFKILDEWGYRLKLDVLRWIDYGIRYLIRLSVREWIVTGRVCVISLLWLCLILYLCLCSCPVLSGPFSSKGMSLLCFKFDLIAAFSSSRKWSYLL
jgi:hypothetical protein